MDFLYVSHRADGAIKLQRLGGAEKAPEVARGKAGAGLSTRCQPRSRAHAAGCARVACRLRYPKRRPAHAACGVPSQLDHCSLDSPSPKSSRVPGVWCP